MKVKKGLLKGLLFCCAAVERKEVYKKEFHSFKKNRMIEHLRCSTYSNIKGK